MKKLVITGIILTNIFLAMNQTGFTQDIARVKNINVTESSNSIDLNLQSSKDIKYDVINYMNGDIGIKLTDTTLNTSFNEDSNLSINKKDSIEDTSIIQDDPYSVTIKLKGNEKLKNKTIKVNNDVQKSNFIIIEPVKEPETSSIIPLVSDIPDIPEIETLTLSQAIDSNKEVSLKEPISMYNEKVDTKKYAEGKMLIAQAQPFNDDTSILDLEDKPLSTTTVEEETLSPPNNAQELTEEETVDDLNTDNTTSTVNEETSDLKDAATSNEPAQKSEGIFAKVFNFLKAQWVWIAGIVGCGIVGIILLLVIGSILGGSKQQETNQEEYHQPIQPDGHGKQHQPEVSEIIDNDPINYIPPQQAGSSQSITDAINQIISIRNKPGK
ncbi:MAG: hypothetical protein AB7V50_05765 [Vampirovibrionia bacterium]